MPSILVAGETIIDFLPEEPGPLDDVERFERRAGGAPANVAVGLARLDATPAFWTRLGADPFGDFLAETLADYGLPDEYVERDPGAKTGLAFVSLDDDADRAFSFYHEGSSETRMEPDTVPDDALDEFDWVHLDCLSLDAEPSRSAVLDLAERASEAGATVSFDLNARPERWTEFAYPEAVREGFALADVVKASPEDLAAADFEGDTAALAREICEGGPHTAIVTLGESGAYAYWTAEAPWGDGGGEATHGGYDVDPVDTTGAGDAFLAGVIAALSEGTSPGEALAFGDAVAATTTTAAGAMTALPDREAVRRLRERRE